MTNRRTFLIACSSGVLTVALTVPVLLPIVLTFVVIANAYLFMRARGE